MIPDNEQNPEQNPIPTPDVGSPDLVVDDGNGMVEPTPENPPMQTGVDDGPEDAVVDDESKPEEPVQPPADGQTE